MSRERPRVKRALVTLYLKSNRIQLVYRFWFASNWGSYLQGLLGVKPALEQRNLPDDGSQIDRFQQMLDVRPTTPQLRSQNPDITPLGKYLLWGRKLPSLLEMRVVALIPS